MMGQLRQELDGIHGSPFLCGLQRANELEQLPVARLHQLRVQLHRDLNTLDQVSRWSRFLYLKCSGHFCAVLTSFQLLLEVLSCHEISNSCFSLLVLHVLSFILHYSHFTVRLITCNLSISLLLLIIS